jgi:exosortase
LGLIFFSLIYWKTFVWLWERAVAPDSYYSHAPLIPFISGYLIWRRREVFSNPSLAGNLQGLIIIVIALVTHLGSALLDVYFTSGFSIAALFFGLTLFLFGRPVARQVLFPLGFLLFMFPLPSAALESVSVPMKLFATKAGAATLSIFGVPVLQEGYQLHFTSDSLVIGNPCSGLRSLIALTALGALFAYLQRGPASKRLALFLAAAPIALIANILRVTMLAFVANHFGSQAATGAFHDVSGFMVFAIALASLYGVGALLGFSKPRNPCKSV